MNLVGVTAINASSFMNFNNLMCNVLSNNTMFLPLSQATEMQEHGLINEQMVWTSAYQSVAGKGKVVPLLN
jgi:hypothetical protein